MSGEPRKARYGLIGYPVSHSMSPAIFNAAFCAAGINAVYELYPIPPDRLDEGVGEILDKGVSGLNVTLPHKARVIGLMKDLDKSARLVGAVNTIDVTGQGMVGYNTDMGGFEDSLGPLGVPGISGARALVLGAGGAARAILVSLARLGASEIIVANRFIKEAGDMVSLVAPGYPDVRFEIILLENREVERMAPGAVLCVQATSLGLNETDPLPMEPALLPGGCFIYDLVYGTSQTAFVRSAKAGGYRAADGKEMLLRQAARAFRLWFQTEPPLDAMRNAIDRAVGNRKPPETSRQG